jgi:exodeoxyribonuclease VII large subunit
MTSMALPFPPTDVVVMSVGELTRSIKSLLEEAHPQVWVEGEVSNLARPASGHLYLTLKDEEAPLKTVIYRGVALRMKFDLRDGMRVIVKGKLTVYPPRGEYQLQVEQVQPKGIGPLELAFRQLKEKLFARGYFDPARKKPLPRIPDRVCLITSGTGSAVRDMLQILQRRWPAVEVWVCPVRVQGEGAAEDIAGAIMLLNRIGSPDAPPSRRIDVLMIGRGGGSLEDLWPFNEEIVANAIHASRIPVVTGVGHEDDLTIADLVADVRALTPSEAAERVVPDRLEVLAALEQRANRMRGLLLKRLELARTKLDDLANRRVFRVPAERVQELGRLVDELNQRLERAAKQRLETARQRLEALIGKMSSLSPLNVLARGYSLSGRVGERNLLRAAGEVRPGERIWVRLHQGQLVCMVEQVESATQEAGPQRIAETPSGTVSEATKGVDSP